MLYVGLLINVLNNYLSETVFNPGVLEGFSVV